MSNCKNIFPSTIENIFSASEKIKRGDLVAFPTETVYGLGANGFDPIAVSKIFEAKNRPNFNPLILHIDKIERLKEIATCNSQKVFDLLNHFWPGPFTIVLPKSDNVPEIVTAGNPTVAIRMPKNEIARKLIELSNLPIAAPSANKFGMLSPTTAEHVAEQLDGKIDFILDGGKTTVGVESSIIEFVEEKFFILRDGGIAREEIEEFLGYKIEKKTSDVNPNSPGQLKSHYAPNKEICFLDETDLKSINKEKTAFIPFKKTESLRDFAIIKPLSENGDFHDAAANLFYFLHELEKENIDLILVEKIPEVGLGKAIMDRLNKAVNHYR